MGAAACPFRFDSRPVSVFNCQRAAQPTHKWHLRNDLAQEHKVPKTGKDYSIYRMLQEKPVVWGRSEDRKIGRSEDRKIGRSEDRKIGGWKDGKIEPQPIPSQNEATLSFREYGGAPSDRP